MKRQFFHLILGLFCIWASSSSHLYASKLMNGGMFYHLGYSAVSSAHGNIEGLSSGLGGRLAFALLPFLYVGGMGFSSTFQYASVAGEKESYGKIGLGGVTGEFAFTAGKATFSLGMLVGGGKFHHFHIISKLNDLSLVSYRHYNTFVFMPLLIAQFPLNEKISIALMTDWIFGSQIAEGNSFGPRLNIGLLFNR